MRRAEVLRLGRVRGRVNGLQLQTRRKEAPARWQTSATRTEGPEKARAVGGEVSNVLRQTRQLNTATPTSSDSHDEPQSGSYSEADHEHAVISTFDLFSIGIGPSSSHVSNFWSYFLPLLASSGGKYCLRKWKLPRQLPEIPNTRQACLLELLLTPDVARPLGRCVEETYSSPILSRPASGEGHMTPSALLLGLESADVETVDTSYVPTRFEEIKKNKKLFIGHGLSEGKGKEIEFDYDRDFVWQWGRKLALHSNGMRLTVFDKEGHMLATNDLFSVGGGFVVNGALSTAATAAASSQAGKGALAEIPNTEGSGGHPADLAENMYYKEIRRADAAGDRRSGAEIKPNDDGPVALIASVPDELATTHVANGNAADEPQQPRYPFRDANSLLSLCHKHNLTIAQLVYENEKSHGYTDDEILEKIFRIWEVMDNSILEGVQAPPDATLPGSLKLHRRAPALYRRLTRGLYPSHTGGSTPGHLSPPSSGKTGGDPRGLSKPKMALSRKETASKRGPPRVHGLLSHPIMPSPLRRTAFPAMDHLSVYAMAVNETNAAGGRIVTAPTNGAAGIIPAVLKYTIEFISDDPERDIPTFLLTAAAIGMLYKRGATISAAEGGCMAEVGVACSMAAGAFAACMGASPETIEQAAEIGIEHNLGLTCDPIGGLVQAPCIERNALGAVKAISSANLALSSSGTQKVRLDDAIRAMRLTANGMRNEFKETSLSGLATSVPLNIPVSVPDC